MHELAACSRCRRRLVFSWHWVVCVCGCVCLTGCAKGSDSKNAPSITAFVPHFVSSSERRATTNTIHKFVFKCYWKTKMNFYDSCSLGWINAIVRWCLTAFHVVLIVFIYIHFVLFVIKIFLFMMHDSLRFIWSLLSQFNFSTLSHLPHYP